MLCYMTYVQNRTEQKRTCYVMLYNICYMTCVKKRTGHVI